MSCSSLVCTQLKQCLNFHVSCLFRLLCITFNFLIGFINCSYLRNSNGGLRKKILTKSGQDKSLEVNLEFIKKTFLSQIYLVEVYWKNLPVWKQQPELAAETPERSWAYAVRRSTRNYLYRVSYFRWFL